MVVSTLACRGPWPAVLALLCAAGGCGPADDSGAAGAGGMPTAGSGGETAVGGSGGTGAAAMGGGGTGMGGTGGEATGGMGGTGGVGMGGAGGMGGGSGDCAPGPLIGFAAESGHGVATTTGGGDAAPVVVTTAAALQQAASDPEPKVIHVSGTITIAQLEIASNKTLLGLGPDATIQGRVRIRGDGDAPAEMVSNVIVRNLHIDAATGSNDGDGLQIYYAHHVWIDHVEIHDAADGNFDIVHGSDFITVSWTKLHYTAAAPDPDHRFSNLIGHSDSNAGEDTGRLHVTFHHTWWADNVHERMPRIRFGQVHLFNNYYSATGNNYAIGAAYQARARIENNFFDGVTDPHVFYGGEATAQIVASGNTYAGVSDTSKKDTGQGSAFTPPYSVTLEPAGGALKDIVKKCAGPQ